MLRRNRETGKMERMVDGSWVPIEPEAETEPSATRGLGWDAIEGMFREVDEGLDLGSTVVGGAGDAVRPVDTSSDAGGDVAVPVGDSSVGPLALVQVDAGRSPGLGVGLGVGLEAGLEAGLGVERASEHATGVVAIEFIDEIPGLTVSDGKSGVRGGRGVLQRLRAGAKSRNSRARESTTERVTQEIARPVQEGTRAPKRVEVAESAAQARGPAVRDTTLARQARKVSRKDRHAVGTVGEVGNGRDSAARIVSKPAPGILSDQPKWVKELFEAHFRSSRTRELRVKPSGPDRVVDGVVVTPNRMKMSREDFAIGWLVLLEAVRRDPAIARIKSWNGKTREEHMGWPPALPTPSNTNS